MNTARGAVVGVVAVILLTTLASGPLMGAVDLTDAADRPAFGHGNVTVEDATLPTDVTLKRAGFGAGGYYLRVPAATVELAGISGRPRLVYEVEIRTLGYTHSSVHAPASEGSGPYSLTMDRGSVNSEDVDADSYDGTVSIAHLSNHTERVIASKPITVEVVE